MMSRMCMDAAMFSQVPIDDQSLIWVDESDHFKDELGTVDCDKSIIDCVCPVRHHEKTTGNPRKISKQLNPVRIKNANFYDHYQYVDDIGEGRFGNVYQCYHLDDEKRRYAAKSILLNARSSLQNREAVEHEIDMLNRLEHPSVAQLCDAFNMTNREIILVMDIIEGGELFERIADRHFVLTELAAAMIVGQLCEVCRYIHERDIIHFDIKPENIMFKSLNGNQIVLIDFGLAQVYRPNMQVMAGTPEFIAPEVTKYETVCHKSDIWSVGVITYILLSGYSPFLGDTDCETYAAVQTGEYEVSDDLFPGVPDQAIDFLNQLLTYDRLKRPSAVEALAHPWLRWHQRVGDQPSLQKTRLKQYVAKRRWKRYVHAIIAASTLQKLGVISSKRNSSVDYSTDHST